MIESLFARELIRRLGNRPLGEIPTDESARVIADIRREVSDALLWLDGKPAQEIRVIDTAGMLGAAAAIWGTLRTPAGQAHATTHRTPHATVTVSAPRRVHRRR